MQLLSFFIETLIVDLNHQNLLIAFTYQVLIRLFDIIYIESLKI